MIFLSQTTVSNRSPSASDTFCNQYVQIPKPQKHVEEQFSAFKIIGILRNYINWLERW